MSSSGNDPGTAGGDAAGVPQREIAHRLFAAEFDDATLSYSESDEERAPNYVVTPTGLRINRLFAVGVLTEVEAVNEETRRGRLVDPTGAFVTYAGQYQPDERAFLERTDPPAFVALSGKARTFEPEDSDRVFTSARPESLNAVDARTRDRWIVSTAESTLERLSTFVVALESDLRGEELRAALAEGGAPASLAAGIPKAIETYETSPAYLEATRRMAVEALELVAGDREEVTRPPFAPGESGDLGVDGVEDVGPLPETDVTIEEPTPAEESTPVEEPTPVEEQEAGVESEPEPEPEATAEPEPEATAEPEPEATAEPEPEATAPESSGLGADDGGDLGDFEDVESSVDADVAPSSGADDELDDTGMYQLDEEERQEVEDEYGTEFETGTEVDEPGSADIEVPDADELAAELESESPVEDADAPGDEDADAPGDEDADVPGDEDADVPGDEGGEEAGDGEADAGTADVDLQSAAIGAIEALDGGDGADRDAVVARVVDEHGVDPGAVEDAIQDALMGGLCYEPGDDRLKAI